MILVLLSNPRNDTFKMENNEEANFVQGVLTHVTRSIPDDVWAILAKLFISAVYFKETTTKIVSSRQKEKCVKMYGFSWGFYTVRCSAC